MAPPPPRPGRAHGKLDVLVANAGILGKMQPPEAVDEDNWRNVFAINVVRGRAPRRRERQQGPAGGMVWPARLAQKHPRTHAWHTGAPAQDGVFHTARAAYPLLKKAGGGKVVITSSVAGALWGAARP